VRPFKGSLAGKMIVIEAVKGGVPASLCLMC